MKVSRESVWQISRENDQVVSMAWCGRRVVKQKTKQDIAEQCRRIMTKAPPNKQHKLYWVAKIWRENL